MADFNDVLTKARNDQKFATTLLLDPVKACAESNFSLNQTQIKLLTEAMRESRKYFFERMFLLTRGDDSLSSFGSALSCC